MVLSAQEPGPKPAGDLPPFTTVWEIILSGGWVMIPLGGLSFIAVTLILVYLFTLRRSAAVTSHYKHTAETLLRKGDFAGLIAISNRHGEALARVVQRTLEFLQHNPRTNFRLLREIAETEGARRAAGFHQQITYLADVGSIAPMVGLFGTVVGMIQSFSVLAGDVAASRPMMLAEGVSVALITTAAGLLIGIPSLAFHAYFRGRVGTLISDLESASTDMLALIALHFQDAGATAPEPGRATGNERGKASSVRVSSPLFDDDF